jgi:hypothetical protein
MAEANGMRTSQVAGTPEWKSECKSDEDERMTPRIAKVKQTTLRVRESIVFQLEEHLEGREGKKRARWGP